MITDILFIYLPSKYTRIILEDEVPLNTPYLVKLQLQFVYCQGQCCWTQWPTSAPQSDGSEPGELREQAPPSPTPSITLPLLTRLRSPDITHRDSHGAAGFPVGSTVRSTITQGVTEFTGWLAQKTQGTNAQPTVS